MGDSVGATQMELSLGTQDIQNVFDDHDPEDENMDEDIEGNASMKPMVAEDLVADGDTVTQENQDAGIQQGDNDITEPGEKEVGAQEPGGEEGESGNRPAEELFEEEEEEEEEEESVAAEDGEEDAGEYAQPIGDDEVVRIPLIPAPGAPGLDDRLMLVGLPTTVAVDAELFDFAQCREYEQELVATKKTAALAELKATLLGKDTLRMKAASDDSNKLLSTFKYVEFSDGTSALVSGLGNVYCQLGSSTDFNAALLEVSQLPVMRVHGNLSQRRLYTKVQTNQLLQPSLLKGSTTRIATNSNKKARKSDEATLPLNSGTTLNAQFLEDD